MYDLVIIGAGWAGFNAAIRSKSLNLRTCLIEKSHIGGTCLNLGCIPTKILLHSAKLLTLNKKNPVFGIESGNTQLQFQTLQQRKEKVILQLRQGMETRLKGIDVHAGQAVLRSPTEVMVNGTVLSTKNILVATGSKPTALAQIPFDGHHIISSNEILSLQDIPKSILIVGGGVIGCEFASLFSSFGAAVTIVEMLPQLLPGIDKEAARKVEISFKKKGIVVHTNSDASNFHKESFERVLVCVGRTPQLEGFGLDAVGIKKERSRLYIDEYLQTSLKNIYAAGDCTGHMMLAHFAAFQGIGIVENIATVDHKKPIRASAVPNCIFTDPEIASVGVSEEEAEKSGIKTIIKKFDFLGSGMARIIDETEGFIKVIADQTSHRIIGATIIGPRATELIAVFSVAIANSLTSFQLKETMFAHPTLSESIHEAIP
ncbi:MAG: dihydrolipoyl dehydrogenase [Candidatus Omnitrophica bacterium]|nr:dihydrolipoyl dehydrogenase [Candidatus Omnitrophota bacterium]